MATTTPQKYPEVGAKVHHAFSFQHETWIVTSVERVTEWDQRRGREKPRRFHTISLENAGTGDTAQHELSARNFWFNWRLAS